MTMPNVCASVLPAILAILYVSSGVGGQEKPKIAPPAKSDTYAEDEKGHKFRVQYGELSRDNFRVGGVDLMRREDVLVQAVRAFGNIESAASGDASTADESACYRSASAGDQTHLFFGKGEMNYYFTLADGAGPLKEKQLCRRSPGINHALATSSGLHSGMTEEELILSLGLPTRRHEIRKSGAEELIYDFEARKKATNEDLAQIRKTFPTLSEAEVRQEAGSMYQSEVLHATFQANHLTLLTVDWLESD